MDNSIRVKCPVCNQLAGSATFRLHHTYKKMVCANCYSGKTAAKEEQKGQKKVEEKQEPARPAGWDAEDDYLERLAKKKKDVEVGTYDRISGTAQVKYTCVKCRYPFKHNPETRTPMACPYCSTPVPKIRY